MPRARGIQITIHNPQLTAVYQINSIIPICLYNRRRLRYKKINVPVADCGIQTNVNRGSPRYKKINVV